MQTPNKSQVLNIERAKAKRAQTSIINQYKQQGFYLKTQDADIIRRALKKTGVVNHKTNKDILTITSEMTQNKALIMYLKALKGN